MEKSDYEELEPLLKTKSKAEVTTPSTILQKVFCLFLLLFPGKDTRDKASLIQTFFIHSKFKQSCHLFEGLLLIYSIIYLYFLISNLPQSPPEASES